MTVQRRKARLVTCAIALSCACSTPVEERRPGQVLLVVDTDMPVPAFVSRLRIDLYDEAGVWYASRDVLLARREDWPTSFGITAPEGRAEVVTTVRLRAYPDGGVRDYRGERYVEPSPVGSAESLAAPSDPGSDEPRLLDASGADVTPSTEPQPLLTIDRFVKVRVARDHFRSGRVLLTGECVGRMADLATKRSCTVSESSFDEAAELALSPDVSTAPSLAGAFGAAHEQPCTEEPRQRGTTSTGEPLFDEEVCIPGGLARIGGETPAAEQNLPERVAIVPPLRIDRYEVTVARWRKALAEGFEHAEIGATEGPLATTLAEIEGDPGSNCTWSVTPRGRESYPINCMSHAAARAFCKHYGGDLPSEVEWEYVAMVAGRPFRTRAPWGDEPMSCSRAVYGRASPSVRSCMSLGFGIQPVDTSDGPGGDVTVGFGVAGMAGSMKELTRDVFASVGSSCWASSSIRARGCFDGPPGAVHAVRGLSWFDGVPDNGSYRHRHSGANMNNGFRCVRPGARSSAP